MNKLRRLGGVLKRVYNIAQVVSMERVRRNIMIPARLDKELDTMAEALGHTRSNVISNALSYYFDIDLDIAKERARRIEADSIPSNHRGASSICAFC